MQSSSICTSYPPNVPKNFLNFHMSPQAWHCKLRQEQILTNHSIIKYSREFINEFLLRAAFPILNLEEHGNLRQLLNKPSDHASFKEDVEYYRNSIISNRELTRMFFIVYFTDYDTFGIDLPQFIIDYKLFKTGYC
jgi:hypothetical protein